MLDQYNQDLHSENDHLGEGRFQMSRRKVVFTLAGASLALLFFLFIVGAFRSEEEITNHNEPIVATASSELVDLQTRVEKLEQMMQNSKIMAAKAPLPETNNAPLTDNALKQLIAQSSASDELTQETIAYQPQKNVITQTPTVIEEPIAPKQPILKTYTIQKGDTLSKVSQKYYGTTRKWKAIYDANRDKISNMNSLKVGTQIIIPEDESK